MSRAKTIRALVHARELLEVVSRTKTFLHATLLGASAASFKD